MSISCHHQARRHTSACTPFVIQELQKHQQPARMHQVEMGSVTEGRVTEGRQLRIQHLVNLHSRTCTLQLAHNPPMQTNVLARLS